ncbi:MAG: acetoacetyl-CoA reductase, partial [Gammaproteobacteria bacterium]
MKTELTGRVALVTGGTSGIGAAVCRQLADSGARVATNYRNEDKARQWLAEARAQGYEFKTYRVDVRDFEGCGQMVAAIENDLGPIDILVNNAGITMDVTFRKMAREQWDTVLGINLDSLFNVTRQVIGGMIDRGFGRIINISSINGQKGQIGQVNYTTTKAGMHGFTMSLAQEVARKGITVNTVSPGYIATEMVMAVPENIRNQIITQIPVGRLGEAQE